MINLNPVYRTGLTGLATGVSQPKVVVELEVDASNIITFVQGVDTVPTWPTGTLELGTIAGVSETTQKLQADANKSTIGGLRIDLVDVSAAVSATLANEVANDREPGSAIVRVFSGFEGHEPTYFEQVATQRVQAITGDGPTFSIRTSATTKRARTKVFRLARTRARASFDAVASVIPVDDVVGFQTLVHGAHYADAPSSTVGYIRNGDEIIRWTGLTTTPGSEAFTGCTRAVFGTPPTAYVHDPAAEAQAIVEYVYLECSVVQAAQAILTGYVDASATLPDTWHANLDRAADLQLGEWAIIGSDIFDPNDESAGLQVRIAGVEDEDAKGYIERELMPIAGSFIRELGDGRLGIRRVNAVLAGAPSDFRLDRTIIKKVSPLRYLPDEVRNVYRIRWNQNVEGDLTRAHTFVDSGSITRYGERPPVELQLSALHGSRHSRASLFALKNTLRERRSEAPMTTQVDCLAPAVVLEVGDKVRVDESSTRDPVGPYIDATTPPPLDRTFEIEGARKDWLTLQSSLELRAVSRRPPPISDCDEDTVLADGFYDGSGTDLSSILTINSGSVDADGTINGGPSMTAGGAIFYYLGDLTIAAGVTVTITDNVQLRIRGTLTVNGTLEGVGQGIGAVVETAPGGGTFGAGLASIGSSPAGTVGYIGRTQAGSGVIEPPPFSQLGISFSEYPAPVASAGRSSVDEHRIINNSVNVSGLPSDLRGTSGAPGQHRYLGAVQVVEGFEQYNGGAGGSSGAGLVIISRGMAFGGSGLVQLDGAPGSAIAPPDVHPGGGGGGAPGALLLLLDGQLSPVPTFNAATFAAVQGANAASGNVPIEDLSDSAFRVQFLPCFEPTTPDRPVLAVPIGLTASLDATTDPVNTVTHQTACGRIGIRLAARVFLSSPAAGNHLARVLVERKLTSEAVGAYTTIWDLSEEQLDYIDRTTLGGDQVLGVRTTLFDRGLLPESYDYRVTVFYTIDSTQTQIPTGELDIDSWDC